MENPAATDAIISDKPNTTWTAEIAHPTSMKTIKGLQWLEPVDDARCGTRWRGENTLVHCAVPDFAVILVKLVVI